ncbi:MAG: hypothetical protein AABW68_03295 [archaeon]
MLLLVGTTMADLFDSMEKIREHFDGASFLDGNPRRTRALESYFSRRGVIQLDSMKDSGSWPVLAYPTSDKLRGMVADWEVRHRIHAAKKWQWQITHLRASSNGTIAHAKKVIDPLYWKHIAQSLTDAEYRSDSRRMDFHPSILMDEKYRPMMDAFVNNPDYRRQLSETVRTSPVYRDHKGLANQAKEKRKMKMEVAQSLIDKTGEQLKESRDQLFMLKELLRWSEEK